MRWTKKLAVHTRHELCCQAEDVFIFHLPLSRLPPKSVEESDMLEKMNKTDEGDMEKFIALDSSEKTIAILGDRWWPQTAKQEGDKTIKKFLRTSVIYGKNVMSTQMLEMSVRSRNGAPSRKGCVVNGQITKASNSNKCAWN